MSREYYTNLTKYGISLNRLKELEAFCRQYHEKKEKLDDLLSVSFVTSEVCVMGGMPSNPTQTKAIMAQELERDIKLIDDCISDACGENIGIIQYLAASVTQKKSYNKLSIVPCGKNQFYNYRKKFFLLLDKKKKW